MCIRDRPVLRNIITVDSERPGCYTWEEAQVLADSVPQSEVEARRRSIDKHDVCNMQYTSGTTGFPKGCLLYTSYPELEEVLARLQLRQFFSGCIVSGKVGVNKPHPEIFRLGEEVANFPSQIWMVGDNPDVYKRQVLYRL